MNKYIAEKLGIAYPELNNPSQLFYVNNVCLDKGRMSLPDFSTPGGIIMLLNLMMQREDWPVFRSKIGGRSEVSITQSHQEFDYVDVSYIIVLGKLRDTVYDYLKEIETTND